MAHDFWKSAGMHLLERNGDGWLTVTPQFLRAYYTRPEVHPIETSCPAEIRLHEALMSDPALPIRPEQIDEIRDPDTASSYRFVLAYRERLLQAGTIEGAYISLMQDPSVTLPPVFIDQMVHVILRNALNDCSDPMRLRVAELLFREQIASIEAGRVMLADEEIVSMHNLTGNETTLIQLLDPHSARSSIELDVLSEENKDIYWERSDRYDTVIDFRFGKPACDAFCRTLECWLRHLLKIETHIEPRSRIDDPDWRWHIGLDSSATHILNALYSGEELAEERLKQIIGLFSMTVKDPQLTIDRVKGKPIHLALAIDTNKHLKAKPQNILFNLPLAITA